MRCARGARWRHGSWQGRSLADVPPLVVALEGGLSLADHAAERRLRRWLGMAEGDPVNLPLNEALIDMIKAQPGRRVVLLGDAPTEALGVLAARIGPQAVAVSGRGKRLEAVLAALDGADFAFVGAAPGDAALRKAAVTVLAAPPPRRPALLRALRPHHWVKNLLVFMPLLAAHRWADPAVWSDAAIAFLAFCLSSSAIYLANDLLDIADDRAHPEKRRRPLASGRLRPGQALGLALGLMALSALLGAIAGVLTVLAGYVLASLLYSVRIKTILLLDVIWLVGLYCLRLLAGGLATGIAASGWLLAYGACIFAALALAKRCAEVSGMAVGSLPIPKRRSYRPADRTWLLAAGLAASLASGLVLAMYLQDPQAAVIYARPGWLALAGAVIVVWQLRVWWLVRKGALQADPIVFALTDPTSLAAGVGVLLLFAIS